MREAAGKPAGSPPGPGPRPAVPAHPGPRIRARARPGTLAGRRITPFAIGLHHDPALTRTVRPGPRPAVRLGSRRRHGPGDGRRHRRFQPDLGAAAQRGVLRRPGAVDLRGRLGRVREQRQLPDPGICDRRGELHPELRRSDQRRAAEPLPGRPDALLRPAGQRPGGRRLLDSDQRRLPDRRADLPDRAPGPVPQQLLGHLRRDDAGLARHPRRARDLHLQRIAGLRMDDRRRAVQRHGHQLPGPAHRGAAGQLLHRRDLGEWLPGPDRGQWHAERHGSLRLLAARLGRRGRQAGPLLLRDQRPPGQPLGQRDEPPVRRTARETRHEHARRRHGRVPATAPSPKT